MLSSDKALGAVLPARVDPPGGNTAAVSSYSADFKRVVFRVDSGPVLAATRDVVLQKLTVVSPTAVTVLDDVSGEVFEIPVPGNSVVNGQYAAAWKIQGLGVLVRVCGEDQGAWYGVVLGGVKEVVPVTQIGPMETVLCVADRLLVTTENRELFFHQLSSSPTTGVEVQTQVVAIRSALTKAAIGHLPAGNRVLVAVDDVGKLHSWRKSPDNHDGKWVHCPNTEAGPALGPFQDVIAIQATRQGRKDIVALRPNGSLALLIGTNVALKLIDRVPGRVYNMKIDGDNDDGSKLVLQIVSLATNQPQEFLLNLGSLRPTHPVTDLVLTAVDSVIPETVAVSIRNRFLTNYYESEEISLNNALGLRSLSAFDDTPWTNHIAPPPSLDGLDVKRMTGAQCWEIIKAIQWAERTRVYEPVVTIAGPSLFRLSIPQTRSLVHILHTVYESCKLDRTFSHLEPRLAELVIRLTATLGNEATAHYFQHYARDSWVSLPTPLYQSQAFVRESDLEVPSIFRWLQACLDGAEYKMRKIFILNPPNLEHLACLHKVTGVARIYEILASKRSCIDDILYEIAAQRLSRHDIDSMASGLALPVMDVIWQARRKPNSSWPARVLALIGRKDIQMTLQSNTTVSEGDPRSSYDTLKGFHLRSQNQRGDLKGFESGRVADEEEIDDGGCGMDHNETVQLRFIKDRRLDEVQKLLRSTTPVRLTANESPDGELASEQQLELAGLLMRPFGSPVGRGAFSLNTYRATNQTDRLVFPKLTIMGRIPRAQGAHVSLHAEHFFDRFLDWAHFHNGVAAGLRLSLSGHDDESDISAEAMRSWILSGRDVYETETPSTGSEAKLDREGCGHAGLLLALGFQGHLNCLRIADWYEYMMTRRELVAVALMIGLGCAKLGSMDLTAQKLMCMHVRSFSETAFSQPDWTATSNVQSAALVGIGLLFMGTGQRMMVEGLMTEMCRRTQPGDTENGRECLALSAGIGLGMLCLGLGRTADGLYDLNLEDRLVRLIRGGKDTEVASTENRLGCIGSGSFSEDNEAVLIQEGEFIFVGLTAPAAVLAFGLMYLQTNDVCAMQRIELPRTYFELERLQPVNVLLRVLMRSVIMWEEIEATEDWVFNCLAPVLQIQMNESGGARNQLFEIELRSYIFDHVDIDFDALVYSKAASLAASAMALGLRFAGGCDKGAQKILMKILGAFEQIITQRQSFGHVILEVGLDYVMLALSVLMAGSGDVSTLRTLRRLAARNPSSRVYGSHMANSMAIGFLFLGGGCKTFGRDQKSIGGLLCALFPVFPSGPEDNRYHLQALRHLYCLAIDSRLLETREADSGALCSIPVTVEWGQRGSETMMTPCILPWLPEVSSIGTATKRYWQFEVDKTHFDQCRAGWRGLGAGGCGSGGDAGPLRMFVQRKSGHLSYTEDPLGKRGILGRSAHVQEFSSDPVMLSFVREVVESGERHHHLPGGVLDNLIQSCILRSTEDFLPFYLGLFYDACAVRAKQKNKRPVAALNLRFAELYLISPVVERSGVNECLLQPGFLSDLLAYEAMELSPNLSLYPFTPDNRELLGVHLQRNSI